MKKQRLMLGINYKLLISIFLLTFYSHAQNAKKIEEKLQQVVDVETARKFISTHTELHSEIYTYNQEKHTNELSKKLFKLNKGDTFLVEQKNNNAIYKIVSVVPTKHYRASYIFFNARKLSVVKINKLRKDIITNLQKGSEFKDLAGKYSMDRNAVRGGDLGWFEYDSVFPEFINALEKHTINDVFTLDVVAKKRYYLIKKTANAKNIKLLTVLKVTL